jgi:hypothetical protein
VSKKAGGNLCGAFVWLGIQIPSKNSEKVQPEPDAQENTATCADKRCGFHIGRGERRVPQHQVNVQNKQRRAESDRSSENKAKEALFVIFLCGSVPEALVRYIDLDTHLQPVYRRSMVGETSEVCLGVARNRGGVFDFARGTPLRVR